MSIKMNFDQKKLREAFGLFPSGVAAIAASLQGENHVIVASSFSVGVSLEPPLAAFFVQNSSSTWEYLSQAERIGVSILSFEHASICRQLANPNKQTRFNGIEPQATPFGALRIPHASAWFDCSIYATHPAGDHLSVQLLIHDLQTYKEHEPLVFHGSRFTRLAIDKPEVVYG